MWPIEMYIRTTRKTSDAISRRFSAGVSRSLSASSASAADAEAVFSAPFFEAPYPASSTALTIASGEAVPSTPIEFVSRLTEQDVTPGTFETAFSTRVLHAAQLIPVTVYCSIAVSILLSC